MTDPPLLRYAAATSPDPLQASGATTPSENRITIAVFAPEDGPVYCDKIQLAVPKNDVDGNPYFTQAPNWSCSNAAWEIDTSTDIDDWDIGGKVQYYRTGFRTVERSDDRVDYPLNFGIDGILGANTGTLTCLLREHSGTTDTPADFTYKQGALTMPVDEQTFYLNNFLARDPGNPNVPRTKFTVGDRIDLTWESNGTAFQLYDGDGSLLTDGAGTQYTVWDGIDNDTTFTLCATLTSGNAQPQNGFEPIYQYATLTVTVTNPILTDLTVAGYSGTKLTTADTDGLAVLGSVEVQGECTVEELLSAKGDLIVYDEGERKIDTSGTNGLTVLGELYVEDNCAIDGSLRTDGDLTVSSDGERKFTTEDTDGIEVSGELAASGRLTARSDLDVSGDLSVYGSVSGSLSVNGSLSVDESISSGSGMYSEGSRVISENDTIALHNTYYPSYLYASEWQEDSDRWKVFTWHAADEPVLEAYWTIERG
ncbi:hypothetical protein [Nocardia bovistercoris]|uniref:Uncharacterized protein n=1 Tax=Nocardia bovistercoris TaxID=2785916 RepID=A0A931N5J1_9NOCA|nr:hypothetical protein [Nocardia bovistercoris]MBH0779466.1 hypothetical protein [Nocardia bovistercoris]